MKSLALFVLTIALLGRTALSQMLPDGTRYQAALCVSKAKNCTSESAKLSGACKTDTWATLQPKTCLRRACTYCVQYGKPLSAPCDTPPVEKACGMFMDKYPDLLPSPSPSPSATLKKPSSCVWTAVGDSIVVPLGEIAPVKYWTPITRNGLKGIIYKKDKNRGIDPRGKFGHMCFRLKAKEAGRYYLSAVSYAPHVTDNNDFWIKTSKTFRHRRYGSGNTFTTAPGVWLKAYQNNGPKGFGGALSTKDHDPHTFIVLDVKAREIFTVCISGRSFKFELYRIVLINCAGNTRCIFGNIIERPVSPCV